MLMSGRIIPTIREPPTPWNVLSPLGVACRLRINA